MGARGRIGGPARSLGTGSANAGLEQGCQDGVADPQQIWTTLLATGASDEQAALLLWDSGDPDCQALAAEKGATVLKEKLQEAYYFMRNTKINMGIPADKRDDLFSESAAMAGLIESSPAFWGAAFSACTGLVIRGNLFLDQRRMDLSGITALPGGLKVGHDCYLIGGTAVSRVGDDVEIGHRLLLEECPRLVELGSNLRVGETLYMLRNNAFRRFGAGMSIAKDLFCNECPQWDLAVPKDAAIHGRVVSRSPGLQMGS